MKHKILKIIGIIAGASAVVIVLAISLLVFTTFTTRPFCFWGFRWVGYQYGYRECEPEKLLSDLERTFDINFPTEIKNVKTARTPGSWDGTASSFAVRFSADPATLDRFLESFPIRIKFDQYRLPDTRDSPAIRTPAWFTEPIGQGKVGGYYPPVEKMKIYVDTTDKSVFVVYLSGFYHRDREEIQEELEHN